jgi:hypothetical protein
MTTPVDTDDLVQGLCRWLATFSDVLTQLGSADDGSPWLFQQLLHTVVEGSQSAAVVFSANQGGWTAPNDHNTAEFPRLLLDLWVDPVRDPQHDYIELAETYRRARQVYAVLNTHLHRPTSDVIFWGSVRTLGCIRLGEPVAAPVPDGDGMIRLQVYYAVTMA